MSGDKLKLFERAEAAIKLGLSCGVATERPHNIYQIARELLEAARTNTTTELLEALRVAIETLAASRHLIGKYTPDHHWLPEHDERIAKLRKALTLHDRGETK